MYCVERDMDHCFVRYSNIICNFDSIVHDSDTHALMMPTIALPEQDGGCCGIRSLLMKQGF